MINGCYESLHTNPLVLFNDSHKIKIDHIFKISKEQYIQTNKLKKLSEGEEEFIRKEHLKVMMSLPFVKVYKGYGYFFPVELPNLTEDYRFKRVLFKNAPVGQDFVCSVFDYLDIKEKPTNLKFTSKKVDMENKSYIEPDVLMLQKDDNGVARFLINIEMMKKSFRHNCRWDIYHATFAYKRFAPLKKDYKLFNDYLQYILVINEESTKKNTQALIEHHKVKGEKGQEKFKFYNYIIINLDLFKKEAFELYSDLDQWLFVLKHYEDLQELKHIKVKPNEVLSKAMYNMYRWNLEKENDDGFTIHLDYLNALSRINEKDEEISELKAALDEVRISKSKIESELSFLKEDSMCKKRKRTESDIPEIHKYDLIVTDPNSIPYVKKRFEHTDFSEGVILRCDSFDERMRVLKCLLKKDIEVFTERKFSLLKKCSEA
jgi:hypothetical protein